jgi:type I restriction enzyme S subunit
VTIVEVVDNARPGRAEPEGPLPEGWALARIGDYFDSWGGATPSTSNRAYWGGDIPWISSKDVKQPRLSKGTEFITVEALRETRLRLCPAGTVLVVMRSGVLAHSLPVTVADAEVVVNQDLKAFFCPERQLNEWLALAFRVRAQDILHESRKDGTTVQSIQFPLLLSLGTQSRPSLSRSASLSESKSCSLTSRLRRIA